MFLLFRIVGWIVTLRVTLQSYINSSCSCEEPLGIYLPLVRPSHLPRNGAVFQQLLGVRSILPDRLFDGEDLSSTILRPALIVFPFGVNEIKLMPELPQMMLKFARTYEANLAQTKISLSKEIRMKILLFDLNMWYVTKRRKKRLTQGHVHLPPEHFVLALQAAFDALVGAIRRQRHAPVGPRHTDVTSAGVASGDLPREFVRVFRAGHLHVFDSLRSRSWLFRLIVRHVDAAVDGRSLDETTVAALRVGAVLRVRRERRRGLVGENVGGVAQEGLEVQVERLVLLRLAPETRAT